LNDYTYVPRTKEISEKNKKLALHIASWYESTRQ
ncbi:hypothetical protein LB360_10975, partial [Staphylococcus aureus]|nr:hypothetical protein [Staphylococcus aureus]